MGLFWICLISFVSLSAPAYKTSGNLRPPVTFEKGATSFAGHDETIDIDIARDKEQHDLGLMFVDEMPNNHGMLFVFPQPQRLHFWMKNTKIPLSIGFFDAQKKLLNVLEMEPGYGKDEKLLLTYSSAGEAQYALEMNTHWFHDHDIHPNAVLSWSPVRAKKTSPASFKKKLKSSLPKNG